MNSALLLAEFQKDYFDGKKPLEGSMLAATQAQHILHACREKKLPIIHVQHISTHPNASYFLPCTKGAEFYAHLQPVKSETVIKKHYPNSFKDTGLLNYLIKNQINHLIICGMTTELTVDATVRAAYDLGFACTVIHDACAAQPLEFNHNPISAENVHFAFLAALEPIYANVLSAEEFLQKTGARVAVAS